MKYKAIIFLILVLLIVTFTGFNYEENRLDKAAEKYNLTGEEKYCLAGMIGELERQDILMCNFSSPRLQNAAKELIFLENDTSEINKLT